MPETGKPVWLDGQKLFGFTVEKHEIPRAGGKSYLPINQTTEIGCLHTTEGRTVASAIDAMDGDVSAGKMPDPCHFIAGEGRLVQTRPLFVQAASLHAPANMFAFVQIEMVAFSKTTLWLPDDPTLKPAVALMAYCAQQKWIPLQVPNGWPDDIADVKPYPSTNNSRRRTAVANHWWPGTSPNLIRPESKGWWEHMEVPFQGSSWHWNCGALKRSVMLQMAKDLL